MPRTSRFQALDHVLPSAKNALSYPFIATSLIPVLQDPAQISISPTTLLDTTISYLVS